MKPLKLQLILFCSSILFIFVSNIKLENLLQSNNNNKISLESKEKHDDVYSRLEPVEIKKDETIVYKSSSIKPEYVHTENRSPMKKAEIIGDSGDSANGLERPNYLSSVIQSHATSVLTTSAMSGDNSIRYDLDQIKKRQFFEKMAKAQMQNNPNLMVFSGDNISIPNNIPNAVLHQETNSITAPLQNNLELNVSLPNSEKLNLNMNNGLNINNNNNIRGAYLSNINIGNMPTSALGIPNLQSNAVQIPIGNGINPNQFLVNKELNNNMNINAISNNNMNINSGLNFDLIGNNIGAIPSNLNANLLPQPIPIQLDKNVNIGIPHIQQQAILGPNSIGLIPDKNTHMFNLNVQYKNQIPHQTTEILDLNSLERKVANINNMPETELTAILSQLRIHENSIKNENEKLYKTLKRYESQNNVIMDTLKEQINETHNQLNSMIIEVPMNERPLITKEIEDQFTKSLSGYTINKNKYTHLKEIDPTEIYNIANSIKRELDRNEKFYLHGDFNFYN